MKKLFVLILAVVVVLSLSACKGSDNSNAPAAQPPSGNPTPVQSATPENDYPETHLTLSSEWAAGYSFESEVIEPLQKLLDEATGGKLIIDYFPAATLTTSAEAMDAVSSGIVDMAMFPTAYATGQLPITFLVEYPQEFKSSKAASFAMRDWLDELNPEEYQTAGVTRLMCTTTGLAVIAHNANHSITKMDDFKGLQIRGNAIMQKAVNAWGGTGVTVAMPDTYESIRSGIIDGSIAGADAISSFKWTEITSHATKLTVFNASFLLIIGNDKLASLPDEWQVILKDACNQVFEESGCNFQERHGDLTFIDYEERGITVDSFSDEETKKLSDATAPMFDDYATELDSMGYDGEGALKLLREKASKYNELYPDIENPYFK